MNELVDAYETEESYDMGSFNHSYLQARLAKLLDNDKYMTAIELSLDIGKIDVSKFKIQVKEEIKPDVCLYPKRKIDFTSDILKMAEMPLSVIEILSPRQGTYDVLEKFKIYFALGVKSCWLVIPINQSVTVYSAIDKFKLFSTGDIIDEALAIRLPIADIFN